MTRRQLLTALPTTAAAQKLILDTKSYPVMGALIREDEAFDKLLAPGGRPTRCASPARSPNSPVWTEGTYRVRTETERILEVAATKRRA